MEMEWLEGQTHDTERPVRNQTVFIAQFGYEEPPDRSQRLHSSVETG
jgi:hypothetical protein